MWAFKANASGDDKTCDLQKDKLIQAITNESWPPTTCPVHQWIRRKELVDAIENAQWPPIMCPLTLCVVVDPVRITGEPHIHVFERAAILEWLSENLTNPMNRNKLKLSPDVNITTLLEDAPDIEALLDSLFEFIPCSWGRIRKWRDALCMKHNLDANKMVHRPKMAHHPRLVVTQYPKNSNEMYRFYKRYLSCLFTITSVAAKEYALAWNGSELYVNKMTNASTAIAKTTTVFYVSLKSGGYASIAPYGQISDQLFAQWPVKERAPKCIIEHVEVVSSDITHLVHRAPKMSKLQWCYDDVRDDGGQQTMRLGVALPDASRLFLDIYDVHDPSLRWWSSAKTNRDKQRWRLTPMFSANELEADADCS